MIATTMGHNAAANCGCLLSPSLSRTRTDRSRMVRVASKINHGTNSTKSRLPVRLSSSAPINPPNKLGMRSSHNHLRPRTQSNSPRVRHTAVGYAESRATALVASAVTGATTSISNGNVINPPPPASALTAPATMLAPKKKT